MQTQTLKLPDSFINMLDNLPESGMGYQMVKVVLKSGRVLHQHKVLNSELLVLDETEVFKANDIQMIELENKQ